MPTKKGTLQIKHTLVGGEMGDPVWPVNPTDYPDHYAWPATILGVSIANPNLVQVRMADGAIEGLFPPNITTEKRSDG